jgi:hypothetical protein
MMRKSVLLTVAAVAAVAITSSIALAAVNVKGLPTATFSGASVTLSDGNFSGLGNTPAIGVLTVGGLATYTCHNNGNSQNVVPGQNPVPAAQGSTGPFSLGNADHNGRGTVTGATSSVSFGPTPTANSVGCGGGGSNNWTVVPDTLTATTANLTITQGSKVVFCRNYTLGGSPTGTAC